MWPFSNAKAEMLERELTEYRGYFAVQQEMSRELERKAAALKQMLSLATTKRDLLSMQVQRQQQEIDDLKVKLEEASKNDARNSKGRYTKTTDV